MNRKLVEGVVTSLFVLIIAGCGAGGGGGGGGGAVVNSITDIDFLRASDNAATTTVTPSQPVRIVVTTTSTDLLSFSTTVGTLSKSTILPSGGTAEVLLTVSINDANDGRVTITAANGDSLSFNFSVGATNLALGRLSGGAFTNGSLALGLAQIAAGGTTQVTADLVDAGTALPFTEPIAVTFSSPCASSGKATIDSPVTTVNGRASATYKDTNCGANDVITATANVGSQVRTATATLTVQQASAGSIQFTSATPSNIALKGSGGTETSVLVFKVVDTLGNPVLGQTVDFSLNTGIGGLYLDANDATPTTSSAQTNNLGLAQTIVNAGTVSTAIRVTATVNGTGLSTQSSQLYVSTGLPEQDRFSIAATTLNMEAFSIDGVTSTITARLADHFGNPVPDGTAVSFRSEQGSITAGCTTTAGACSAIFTSQGARPAGWNGRSTILATAIGEESFDDNNPSNGLFDATETFSAADDLPEAWLDSNEDGNRDPNEEYLDFNVPSPSPAAYNAADSKYNGSACATGNTNCSDTRSIHVRDSIYLVWSTSEALISFDRAGIVTTPASPVDVTWYVSDLNGNPMPFGTAISLSTTNGAITGTTSFTVPNTNVFGPFSRTHTITGDATSSNGFFTIKVTSPSGLITEASIPVSD